MIGYEDGEITRDIPQDHGLWAPPPQVKRSRRDLWRICGALWLVAIVAWANVWIGGGW